MADGPVLLLPPGLDAYAGYVNVSGIGITYPQVVAAFPAAKHLSVTTDGSPADCADVEKGTMSDWTGYPVGYCSVENAMTYVGEFGRPKKLWTAHYTEVSHICGPGSCAFPGLTIDADGTQWHSASYDESLLLDDFFDFQGDNVGLAISDDGCTVAGVNPAGHLLVFSTDPDQNWSTRWQPQHLSVSDVTEAIQAQVPGSTPYLVQP